MNRNQLWECATLITPAVADFDEARRLCFFKTIDEALAGRPGAGRQFGLFLWLVKILSVFFIPQKVFSWLENNRLGILRKGFWGLKVLCCMGCYTDPAVISSIGYSPKFRGNERVYAVIPEVVIGDPR